MRRSIRSVLKGISTVLVLAACQDVPVAPTADVADVAGMPDFKVTANYSEDHQSADIRVTRTGGWFVLGPHAVYFPRGSICSLESTYGPSEWDKPCVAARNPIDFHVEIQRDAEGRSWLSFSPAVRFVPSRNRSQFVMLYMWAGGSAQEVLDATPTILWAPETGGEPIDESLTDPTLVSNVIPGTSVVYRRIKHFSSYMVGAGFTGTHEELGGGEGEGEAISQIP